jgi:hypothetical protein
MVFNPLKWGFCLFGLLVQSLLFAVSHIPCDTLILDGQVVTFEPEEVPSEDSLTDPNEKKERKTIAQQRWFTDLSFGVNNTITEYSSQLDGWLTLNEFMGDNKIAKANAMAAWECGGTIWHVETQAGELNLSVITGVHAQQYQSAHLILKNEDWISEDSILSLRAENGLLLLDYFDVFNPGQFPPIGEADTLDIPYAASTAYIRAFEIPLRIQVIGEFGNRNWRWNAQAGVVQRLVQHGFGESGYRGEAMLLVTDRGEVQRITSESILPKHVIAPQFSIGIERVLSGQHHGRNHYASLFLQFSLTPSARISANTDVMIRQQNQSIRCGFRKYF